MREHKFFYSRIFVVLQVLRWLLTVNGLRRKAKLASLLKPRLQRLARVLVRSRAQPGLTYNLEPQINPSSTSLR